MLPQSQKESANKTDYQTLFQLYELIDYLQKNSRNMNALEFKSKIKDNQILIPTRIQSRLKNEQNKNVRVIVLFDDSETSNDLTFKKTTQKQFLEGYAESDSIYDK